MKINILHVLSSSLPSLSGYDIRSHNVLKYQREFCDPYAITFLDQNKQIDNKGLDIIDGIKYYRSSSSLLNPLNNILSKIKYLRIYTRPRIFQSYLYKFASNKKPSIIHAHSSFHVGIPALNVAKSLKIPFVYEVRGLWYMTATALKEMKKNSFKYKYFKFQEERLIKESDALITISDSLREYISNLDINRKNIFVIPNCVDTVHFSPRKKDVVLIGKYNLEDKIVLGYVGSIRRLEGLDKLILSIRKIASECKNVILLIVGYGKEKERLIKMVNQLGLTKYVLFTGKVPHQDIIRFYSLIDIFVLPRPNFDVNSLVTPLKPLEAMSLGKAVIASDLKALKEFVNNGKTGLMFKNDDINDLADKCVVLIKNSKLRHELGDQSRKWILQNRDWKLVIKKYEKIYESILSNNFVNCSI